MALPTGTIQQLTAGGIVTLYELDLSPIDRTLANPIHRFSPHASELETAIVWQGRHYDKVPIEAEGFEQSSSGPLPRPKLRVSNIVNEQISGAMSALCLAYEDLVGARLTRTRVMAKHLPTVNFADGTNPAENPALYFEPELWWVEQKTYEGDDFVEWELASPMDMQGLMLPRRQVLQNICPWEYRGPDCGYDGSLSFDALDRSVDDPALDVCGGRFRSCKLRHGNHQTIPFGGHPGAGSISF
ncbi:MAG: phage minor tail protein L [Methylococcaceae bacterium]|nr:MAG: phage minor tail protein L [Methylococcaceae bacterium]